MILYIIYFRILCCENFRPRSCKFGSPGDDKWPHLIKCLNDRQSYTTPTEWLPWNFQWLIRITVSIKFISQNYYIGDFRSGQFCELSMGENWKRLFWTKSILNTIKHQGTGKIHTLNRKITPSDPSSWPQDHFRSWKVTGSFSTITFDIDQLKQWKTP